MHKLFENEISVNGDSMPLQSEQSRYTSLMSYNAEAFSRNIGLLTLAEQEKLASTKVAIAGMGGVGGVHLVTLLRTGIANFNISDMDDYELANMNRQYGAKIRNLDQPKVEVMVKEAHEINPYAEIKTYPKGISEENVDAFLKDVDIVVDGMDAFNIKIRRLIFNTALAKGIPVITAGPIGFSSALIVFMPNKMGFDEYFDIHDGMDEDEQLLRFFVGLTPKFAHLKYVVMDENSIKTKSGPSLSLACQMCSATATTEVLRIILNKKGIKAAPYYFQYDLLTRRFIKSVMPLGNKNPIQKLKLNIAKQRMANLKPTIGPEKITPPELSTPITGDIPDEVMGYILKAGQQAPSGENTQPWKLSYKTNTIHLELDPEADKSLFNVNQIASIIACGAVAENIKISASKYGLMPTNTLLTSSDNEKFSAKISLQTKDTIEDPKARFIWERQTNRTKYNRKLIPQEDLDLLKIECAKIAGTTLDLYTDKADLNTIAKLVKKADVLRMETQSIHELLMSNIHFSDEEALVTRDGFHLKNLEAGFEGELFLKMIKPWWVADKMNKIGMSKVAANLAAKGIKQASAIGMIRIDGTDQKSFFEGGRAMERVWLEATRLGISFQPMTILTFLRVNWILGRRDIFNAKHTKLLEDIWTEYEKVFPCRDDQSQILLFRLGYGQKVKTGTLRKEITL